MFLAHPLPWLLAAVTAALNLPLGRLDFVHNTVFVLIDGKGRLRTEFHGLATPTEEIAKEARTLFPLSPGPSPARGEGGNRR